MIFYTYLLFRPWSMEPCYVGKGQDDRVLFHSKAAERHYNKRLGRIVKKAGCDLPFIFLYAGSNETEAYYWEVFFIRWFGRSDLGLGPLCNLTDGGEGTSGRPIPQAQREAHSKRLLGNQYVATYSRSERGRAIASATHKGKIIPPQTRAAAAKSAAERVWTPELRAKVAASKIGRKLDAATVEAMRVRATVQFNTPEAKAAVAKANSERVWTPEMRKAHGIRMAEVAAQKRKQKMDASS